MPFIAISSYPFPFLTVLSNLLLPASQFEYLFIAGPSYPFPFLIVQGTSSLSSLTLQALFSPFSQFQANLNPFSLFQALSFLPRRSQVPLLISHYSELPLPLPHHFSQLFHFLTYFFPSCLFPSLIISANSSPFSIFRAASPPPTPFK